MDEICESSEKNNNPNTIICYVIIILEEYKEGMEKWIFRMIIKK